MKKFDSKLKLKKLPQKMTWNDKYQFPKVPAKAFDYKHPPPVSLGSMTTGKKFLGSSSNSISFMDAMTKLATVANKHKVTGPSPFSPPYM